MAEQQEHSERSGVTSAVADLCALDVPGLDADGVRAAMRSARPIRGWLDHLDAQLRNRARELNDAAERERERDAGGAGPGGSDGSGDGHGGEVPPDGSGTAGGAGWGGIGSDSLDDDAGVGSAEGRKRDARSRLLARFTGLSQLLENGRITVDHLDVLASAVNSASEEIDIALDRYADRIVGLMISRSPGKLRRGLHHLFNEIAGSLGVDLRRRQREATRLRHWLDQATGMGRLVGEFDPETYKVLSKLLDQATMHAAGDLRDVDIPHVRALTLVDMLKAALARTATPARGQRSSTGSAPSSASASSVAVPIPNVQDGQYEAHLDYTAVRGTEVLINVIVDLDTFLNGRSPEGICEYNDGTPIDVSLMRRWACEAGILPVVLNGDGVPIDVGRTSRLATAAQRHALHAIYATCAMPDCDRPVTDAEVHHIAFWEHGHPTDLENLIPVCSFHHHRIHDEGWRIVLDGQRNLTITTPDGTIKHGRPDRRPDRRSTAGSRTASAVPGRTDSPRASATGPATRARRTQRTGKTGRTRRTGGAGQDRAGRGGAATDADGESGSPDAA